MLGFPRWISSLSMLLPSYCAVHSPRSPKTVYPTAIYHVEGTVQNASNLAANQGSATLSGNNLWATLDIGKEVGGVISLNFENVTSSSGVSVSFTESSLFIRHDTSDNSLNSTFSSMASNPSPPFPPVSGPNLQNGSAEASATSPLYPTRTIRSPFPTPPAPSHSCPTSTT
ncbi:hypothetical protein OF83DRAFT_481097 [Amylostereum chailletii]|nr:hypothetical protein OF83DRAFT_481097 [Amylostereum chailletii]